MQPILLFDIDGTLLRVKKSFMINFFGDLIRNLQIPDEKVAKTSFAGRTDRDIFSELTANLPDADRAYEQLRAIYIERMQEYFSPEDADVIEGAGALLSFASHKGFAMGLCTGNYRETALLKVKAAGFDHLFTFGGFGCNHADRVHLPEEAHQEYLAIRNGTATPLPSDYIVIGDTPNDVRCARYFGARVVTVSTGDYSDEQLQRCNPDLHVSNLSDVIRWLR